ncbi:rifin PIR protein,putative [Plasmodium sp. DRC-Itaito]|nr:rifin PIR protein,putative [Plasmodium sp. DRC-Itaito]
MNLQYSKILLFFLQLSILVTSYVNTNKKPHTTPHHTPRYTSRVLSEGDTQSSNYDKDTGMKSVMQQFVDRTSQRFKEYEERMKEKRQKRKEERDKNIQKIIEKDKKEKSLAQKIEKGCLRCGCGLGGGVLPVWGLVSGLWYATWSQYLSAKALPAGIKKGIEEGLKQIVQIVARSRGTYDNPITAADMLASGKFTKSVTLYDMVKHISTMYEKLNRNYYNFWSPLDDIVKSETIDMFNTNNSAQVAAVEKAFAEGKAAAIAADHAEYAHLYSAIGYSFLAILIIVLVMIIIYLVLRYRRKKKMKKKAQYTKLLNE